MKNKELIQYYALIITTTILLLIAWVKKDFSHPGLYIISCTFFGIDVFYRWKVSKNLILLILLISCFLLYILLLYKFIF